MLFRLVALTVLLGCASPSPHEVLWAARQDEHSHKQDCADSPLFDSFLAVPWYVVSGDYKCPDQADAFVPTMGDYHECLARVTSRRRDCVVRSCDSDQWDACSGSSCSTPSMEEMRLWNCALNRCGFEQDPSGCLEE